MTEADWLAYREPGPLLDALGDLATPRKRRLFACACCRRVHAVAPHLWDPAVLDVAERFADGLVTDDELGDATSQADRLLGAVYRRLEIETGYGTVHPADSPAATRAQAAYAALRDLRDAIDPVFDAPHIGRGAALAVGGFAAAALPHANEWEVTTAALAAGADERAAQADLVRDLFTDRLWFVVPHPAWFTADVMSLAQNIYDGRAFEHMPILADALQDAGCDSDAVLNHCRNPQQLHARGCWVLDLILGKM